MHLKRSILSLSVKPFKYEPILSSFLLLSILSHRGLMSKFTKSFKLVPECPSSSSKVNVGCLTFQCKNVLHCCSGYFVVLFMKWWKDIWPCTLSLGALAIVKPGQLSILGPCHFLLPHYIMSINRSSSTIYTHH